ncbi:hypothetical protein F2Q69_00024514 [Brassica cretica]|uniref:Uncharacterized protein n=1 Tax=Brassica cretica TaxID=69181 RepID=A0A8S9QFE4_BRACR|nr:hypothetical protein F2Q69_00024514 [Brassica cretica]
MVDSEDRYSTEKASSAQLTILYDCDFSSTGSDQSKFCSIDTPPKSSKNCPEAKGGSVRVQFRPYRPVSVYMVKPIFCPSQDQFSPVKSSLGFWPTLLRSTSYLSAKNTRMLNACLLFEVSQLLTCLRWISVSSTSYPVGLRKETPYSLDREHSERRGHGPWLSGYTDKVALGKDERIAECWTLGSPV